MKDKHVSIPMTILSLAIGIIVIFPIIWLVLSSFKPSGELFTYPLHMFPSTPTTEHYKSVLDGGFMGYVKNSLFLAVVGTLITLLISAMCGYALAIYRFEIKYVNLVFGVFLGSSHLGIQHGHSIIRQIFLTVFGQLEFAEQVVLPHKITPAGKFAIHGFLDAVTGSIIFEQIIGLIFQR